MNKKIDIKITDVKTQRQMVIYHLQHDGDITSLEAFRDYGITRLSSIIHTLRSEGYSIVSNPVTRSNRFGNAVTFSRYTYTAPINVKQLDIFEG